MMRWDMSMSTNMTEAASAKREIRTLQDFKPQAGKRYAIILGNEVKGVQQDVVDECDGCIEIPQFGTKHSLNVSVTGGILIWEFARLLKL